MICRQIDQAHQWECVHHVGSNWRNFGDTHRIRFDFLFAQELYVSHSIKVNASALIVVQPLLSQPSRFIGAMKSRRVNNIYQFQMVTQLKHLVDWINIPSRLTRWQILCIPIPISSASRWTFLSLLIQLLSCNNRDSIIQIEIDSKL